MGQIPTKSDASSENKLETGRFAKVKSAVQSKLPFLGGKQKDKSQQLDGGADAQPNNEQMNYTSDMVDVLDTIGMFRIPWGT